MPLRLKPKNPFLLLFLALATCASNASTITGTVKNGTTLKPSAGDTVILLKLAGGMEEETRTKSDSKGGFTLNVQDSNTPHIVRVNHQNVNYHAVAPPGTQTVGEVVVYDASAKLSGIAGTADVMRIQSDGDTLRVAEIFALRNNSTPPRSLMNNKTFEIYLPKDAQMDSSMAAGPGGMPVNSAPVPLDPGHYAFVFPLRPGETQFRVEYHIPYSGSASFVPRITVPMDMVAIELPKSIQFSANQAGYYNVAMDDKGVVVQAAKNVMPGSPSGFRIAGNGAIPPEALKNLEGGGDDSSGGGNESASAAAAPTNRPGGGMATPEGTPDPMEKYRWPVLLGFVAALGLGAFWITTRQSDNISASPSAVPGTTVPASGNRSGSLLDALKEELFQLESERLQKKISEEDYAKAKAALDTTLARAMQRKS